MKDFLGALAFATAFTFAQSASALIIEARLDSFESTPITVAGVGTGGGRGTFTLLGSDSVVPSNLASILDASFQAICLEPDSYITTGLTYSFFVTDLQFAPTTTGGMGAAREAAIEDALGRIGMTDVESLDLLGVSTVTAGVYEAGYESAVNALDLTSGTAVVTGAGAADAQAAIDGVGAYSTMLTSVDAFALINLGPSGGFSSRTVFEGQDFMVTTASAVPSPAPLALFGMGMLGLVGMKRFRA
jgi:hypothetical protein